MCFKNVYDPSCTDLFLTNSVLSFQHTLTVSSEFSHYKDLNFNDELTFNV